MTTAHTLKTALAACHLLLVVCGAAGFAPTPAGSLPRKALGIYGAYSGANNGYGFFAPAVASAWEARFSLYGESGPGWTDEAGWGGNREVRQRVSTILGFFAHARLREGLAASWAAQMFAHHPEARLVNVHVRRYHLPTMAEYRQGERPEWQTVAVFPFARNVDGFLDEE